MKTVVHHTIFVFIALVVMFVAVLPATASPGVYLNGVVRDSLTREPIPYVAIYLEGTDAGVMTGEDGEFKLYTNKRGNTIKVSVLGYDTKVVPVLQDCRVEMDVELVPAGVKLDEVVVKPQKEKYSKKNNPAVDFMEKIRSAADLTDPHRHDYYNYEKYEKITLALNDFNPNEGSWVDRKFKFVKEHIDTSDVSGKPILNVSVKEKSSAVHFRKNPKSEKEQVHGIKRDGVDQIMGEESMQEFFEDIFREIDIYDKDINILQNRFVSPLSPIAAEFYKFYLSDTIVVDGDSCVALSFVPRVSETFGFTGRLYVPKNDSTMFIKRVDLHVPHDINLNFVETMSVSQEYTRASDGTRLKTKDDMTIEFSVIPGAQGLYARRNTAYANHDFSIPSDDSIFNHGAYRMISSDAYKRDYEFWETKRLVEIERGEKSVSQLLAQMRSVPLYYWGEKFLKIMVTGYISPTEKSPIFIGPMNTTASYNAAEGLRLRLGGMTNAYLSKRWFGRGYVAYGLRDQKWKYRGEVEYSFIDKKNHSREFPVKSLRLTHLYDVDQLGQQYIFTNQDNLFLSFKRMDDDRVTYHRKTMLDYTLELENGFSVVAGFSHERQEATHWLSFVNGHGEMIGHYIESGFNLKLRFAPGEKFYQGHTNRYPINLDAPVFELMHSYMPRGFLGSRYAINRTEFRFQKRFWLSAFGYVDAVAKAGHVWESAPFLNLLLPNANISYTIQPESYALMNPLEFINDTYASVDLTYWANGALFNRVPLLKKLKLREVVSYKCLWGHLSKNNDPRYNSDVFMFPENISVTRMSDTPYMEASVGVENILQFLRVDYVWRLTYRDAPGAPNSGVRVAMHFTF